MTREEAIKELEEIAEMTIWNYRRLATTMAIEALSSADRPTGEWVIDDAHTEHCSVCGHTFYTSALFAVGGNDEPNFCPNCGARMYKGGEDE